MRMVTLSAAQSGSRAKAAVVISTWEPGAKLRSQTQVVEAG